MSKLKKGGFNKVKSSFELAESRVKAGHHSTFSLAGPNPDLCPNGCGQEHKFWTCHLPLKPTLAKKKEEFRQRQRARAQSTGRASNADAGPSQAGQSLEAIEAQIAALQRTAANKKKKNSRGRPNIVCSLTSKPAVPTTKYTFSWMVLFCCLLAPIFARVFLTQDFGSAPASLGF
jgi:hypothetical protein